MKKKPQKRPRTRRPPAKSVLFKPIVLKLPVNRNPRK